MFPFVKREYLSVMMIIFRKIDEELPLTKANDLFSHFLSPLSHPRLNFPCFCAKLNHHDHGKDAPS